MAAERSSHCPHDVSLTRECYVATLDRWSDATGNLFVGDIEVSTSGAVLEYTPQATMLSAKIVSGVNLRRVLRRMTPRISRFSMCSERVQAAKIPLLSTRSVRVLKNGIEYAYALTVDSQV